MPHLENNQYLLPSSYSLSDPAPFIQWYSVIFIYILLPLCQIFRWCHGSKIYGTLYPLVHLPDHKPRITVLCFSNCLSHPSPLPMDLSFPLIFGILILNLPPTPPSFYPQLLLNSSWFIKDL